MPATLDLQAAKANPSRFFKSPRDVVSHPGIPREAKIEILRQWETDARLLSVAEEENLQGGEASQLSAVVNALIALGADEKQPDPAHRAAAPGKAGHQNMP